ncbi:MAG: ABC transporter permease [Chloroflexi bacterium]|nr:ABC transporter permease [Chloroflexota bacterium]
MRRFLIRRFLFMILSTIAATAIVFSLSRAVGDPLLLFATSGYGISDEAVAEIRKELALDRSYPEQYLLWLGRVLRGDLGQNLAFKLPVARIISEKIPHSLQLGTFAWFFSGTIGVSLGVLSAIKRGTMADYGGRFVALIGQSIPVFWFAIILIMVFAVWLDWLPAGLAGDSTQEPSLWQLEYLVLPVTAMSLGGLAGYLRLTRSSMLEVLDSEYVKLARAKGVGTTFVVWKHAFRNALIQPLTASTLAFAGFIEGALVVETIFSRPGIGLMAVQAVHGNDFPILQGAVLMFILVYVIATFLTDIVYALVDPRIRYD